MHFVYIYRQLQLYIYPTRYLLSAKCAVLSTLHPYTHPRTHAHTPTSHTPTHPHTTSLMRSLKRFHQCLKLVLAWQKFNFLFSNALHLLCSFLGCLLVLVLKCFAIILAYFLIMLALSASSRLVYAFCLLYSLPSGAYLFSTLLPVCGCVCFTLAVLQRVNKACYNMQTKHVEHRILPHTLCICFYFYTLYSKEIKLNKLCLTVL